MKSIDIKIKEMKDRLEKEFNQLLKKEIKKLKKEVKNDNIPSENDIYWTIYDDGEIGDCYWENFATDYYRLYSNKIWLNEKDCQRYAEIDYKYRVLIYSLNQKNPIDWEKDNFKYHLYVNEDSNKISQDHNTVCHLPLLYCSDRNLKQKAINLIGEEDLIWYLKNYRA